MDMVLAGGFDEQAYPETWDLCLDGAGVVA